MMRPAAVVLFAASAVPTAAGLSAALWYGSNLAALARVLQAPGMGLSLASSVWTGVVATTVSLLLAHLAVAVALTGKGRARLAGLSLPLLAMPHLAIGIGLALLLSPSGLLLRLAALLPVGLTQAPDWLIVHDPLGLSLIAGLVVKETVFLVLVLVAALSQVPSDRLMLQTRSLGYGRLKAWLVAVAPLLQRQIRLPLAAVLVFGLTNVEMAIPLGPDLPPTFAVLLWQWFSDPDPSIHAQAYTGSLLLMATVAMVVFFMSRVAALAGLLWQRVATSGSRWQRERGIRRAASLLPGFFWLLGMLAVLAALLRSAAGVWRFPDLLPTGDAIARMLQAFPAGTDVMTNTLFLAAATAATALALVLPAAEQLRDTASATRKLGSLLFLPLLLPQMTFLFGLQILFVRLRADGSFAAVLWSHLVFALPYLWGIVAAARGAMAPQYLDVARTLGAGRTRAWLTITAPLLLRSALLGLAVAFSVSVALYLPTLFAGAGRFATASTEAAAAAASGTLRSAAAQALVLAALPLVAFALALASGAAVFRNRRDVPR